ncbi:MAG: phosphatidate cytidylyltransferase, partial [Candidatus Omnitrophica bacterium]|nr:phosphatidate cytidylyltransferase [Candidatus Omnitrophota bacterium]
TSCPRMTNLEPILIVGASLYTLTLQFLRRDNAKDHLVSTALTMFSLMYIGWFFSFLVKIRLLDNGANLALFLILVTKSADMGAYAVGSLMGRHELIPRISPNKTKEGTLGGVLISVLTAMVLGKILTHYPAAHLVVLGGAVAVLGQIGDLAESLIKRDCGVKDSGVYFAGIGGMLDLVDSLLFTAPFFYFYVRSL